VLGISLVYRDGSIDILESYRIVGDSEGNLADDRVGKSLSMALGNKETRGDTILTDGSVVGTRLYSRLGSKLLGRKIGEQDGLLA